VDGLVAQFFDWKHLSTFIAKFHLTLPASGGIFGSLSWVRSVSRGRGGGGGRGMALDPREPRRRILLRLNL